MADYHTVYKDVEGTTTEWEDLQIKAGNLPAKEKPQKEAWTPAEDARQGTTEWLDGKSERELEEAEDAVDDDRFLEEYRQKRLAELKNETTAPRYGAVKHISGADYIREVSQAGQDVWVLVHLYKDHISSCQLMADCLEDLASKYPGTKFVKIISTDCIPNYPDSNLPTLLVYLNGAVKTNITGLAPFGGKHATSESVAFALLQVGPVLQEAQGGTTQEAVAEQVQRRYLEKLIAQREMEQKKADAD